MKKKFNYEKYLKPITMLIKDKDMYENKSSNQSVASFSRCWTQNLYSVTIREAF